MKEEKPKLVLNKRTIAHLNNFEMRNVRGGDGDGETTIQTRVGCGLEDLKEDPAEAIRAITRSALSKILGKC
jgi:hypothetical protein